jgi:AcrR family transcriptional regulator
MVARKPSDNLKEVIRDFRREQVVSVARRLFGERGTTNVSMDEIAAEAGVSRSTVYVYFANRDELLRACLKGMHDQLLDDIAVTWEQESDPQRRLECLICGLLERIDDDPAFFRQALVAQGSINQGGRVVEDELALIGLNIARLISDLVVEGVIRPPRSSASRSTAPCQCGRASPNPCPLSKWPLSPASSSCTD